MTIGHQYSTLALLSEKEEQVSSSWVMPLSTTWVASDEDIKQVGVRQVNEVLDNPKLPRHDELIVQVGESRYSKSAFIYATLQGHDNLVSILQARSNRTFYHVYEHPDGE